MKALRDDGSNGAMSNKTSYLRWYAKKAARTGVALGSWGADGLLRGHGAHEAAGDLHVLTYHRFGDAAYDPFCVATDVFAEHMRILAESELAVSIADVEAYLSGRTTLPAGAVLVTIDDGFRSVYTHALPILERYAIPAVVYLPVGCMDGGDVAGADLEPRLSWSEVAALVRGGQTIGSHAWSHLSLGTMNEDQLNKECTTSRIVLEEKIGRPVTSFAYPFGTRADYNDKSYGALKDADYRSAFTSQHGPVRWGDEPLELSRIKVEGGEPLWMFRRLIRGGLDRWQWVDRTLWRLQANHEADSGPA
jgi:peptidoglycan/xylan/chitin deacetylase (PgdA/CDA1 family)